MTRLARKRPCSAATVGRYTLRLDLRVAASGCFQAAQWPGTRQLSELGLLAANPAGPHHLEALELVLPGTPAASCHPCRGAGPLAEVTRIRPELTAFFGCLYYAALRAAEAVALRTSCCTLPSRGWGQLTLTAPFPAGACLDH